MEYEAPSSRHKRASRSTGPRPRLVNDAVRAAMAMLRLPSGAPRLPLTALSAAEARTLRAVLAKSGLLTGAEGELTASAS